MTRMTLVVASSMALMLAAQVAVGQCTLGETEGTAEEHCQWGRSVAISGNGAIALVGGPGAYGIDGVVRPFEWDGVSWVEQSSLFPDSTYAYAAEFGWSVDLSYDGNTAVIGAPGDMHDLWQGNRRGAIYILVRDENTGDWSQQARLTKPSSGPEQSFGHAVSISDDGNTVVAGQRQHLGDMEYLPDSAWVFTRDGDVWSDGVELVGTDLDPYDEYSFAVAVSPDGSRALVSAIGDGLTDGRVFVFKYDGSGWPIEQVLDYPEATNWNSFGNDVDINGDLIVVGDMLNDDLPPGDEYGDDTDNAGAVHLFDFDGSQWVRQPEFLIAPMRQWGLEQYMFGHTVALTGDCLIVGCPNSGGWGYAYGAAHIHRLMDDKWTITGTITAEDPQENTDFGWSVDIAADGANYVIGEPTATVDDVMWEGRAHFVNAVSAEYEYEVEPDNSPFTVTFYFLGAPVTIELSANGDFVGIVTDDCDDKPGSFLITDAALGNADEPIEFEMPWTFWDVVITDLLVTVYEVGNAGELDDTGTGYLTGYKWQVGGWVSVDGNDPIFYEDETDNSSSFTAEVTGGYGEPFNVVAKDVYIMADIDFGWGEYNPSVLVQGTVGGTETEETCPEDVNADDVVDINDVFAVLGAWGPCDACPEDIDESGSVDIDDLFAILGHWGPCP